MYVSQKFCTYLKQRRPSVYLGRRTQDTAQQDMHGAQIFIVDFKFSQIFPFSFDLWPCALIL